MLKSKIESILHIAGRPVSLRQLSSLLRTSEDEIERAVEELTSDLKARESGLSILKIGKEVQLGTNFQNSEAIQEFLKEEIQGELTRPALETLTILAYRGPLTKSELENIRGVNCSLILRNLALKGLITKEGAEGQEKHMASFEFLKMLQISDFKELPEYEALNQKINEVIG